MLALAYQQPGNCGKNDLCLHFTPKIAPIWHGHLNNFSFAVSYVSFKIFFVELWTNLYTRLNIGYQSIDFRSFFNLS